MSIPSATCSLRTWALTSGASSSWTLPAAGLVLDERAGVRQLADVVVVGGHAGQQRVGADRLRGPLGQVADHQRVVVGPRRLEEEPPQERLRRVGQLQELEDGEDPEEVADRLERAHGGDRRADPGRQRGTPQLEDAGQVAGPQQREDRDDHDVGDDDREAGLQEDPDPVAAAHGDDPGHAPHEDIRRELQGEAVGGPGEDGQHGRDHRGRAGAEQDGDEHRRPGARHEERQDGAARGQLVGEGRDEQHEPQQGERAGPVPELLPVAPGPGEQAGPPRGRPAGTSRPGGRRRGGPR